MTMKLVFHREESVGLEIISRTLLLDLGDRVHEGVDLCFMDKRNADLVEFENSQL